MSQPLIFETARSPLGQPVIGVVTDPSTSREAMDPDTYDWAYVDTSPFISNTGPGATGRVKVVCNNAIDGTGTTTYTWSFQGGNSGDGSFFAAASGGSALTGGALAGTDLTYYLCSVRYQDWYLYHPVCSV